MGNGIPDVAELALLEKILSESLLDLSWDHGLPRQFVQPAYEHNLEQVTAELAGVIKPSQTPWLNKIIAAYLTLGDYGHEMWICGVVKTMTGHALSTNAYQNQGARFLEPREDADGDNVTNLEEWEWLVENFHGTSEEGVKSYVANALDKHMKYRKEIPPGKPEECWNDKYQDPRTKRKLIVHTEGTLHLTSIRIKLDYDLDGYAVDLKKMDTDPPLIFPGRIVELIVEDDDSTHFYRWSIPGTLGDGAIQKRITFTVPDGPLDNNEFIVTAEGVPIGKK